jgi:hypothetical protein
MTTDLRLGISLGTARKIEYLNSSGFFMVLSISLISKMFVACVEKPNDFRRLYHRQKILAIMSHEIFAVI